MALESLSSVKGAHKKKKLLGRGPGSGHGKTSTRGHKGQRSRSGRDFYLGFEGGQSPLIRRIPKRGFHHKPARQYQLVNLKGLSNFSEGSLIDSNVLAENRLIKNSKGLIKILAEGRLTHALTVRAHKFSKGAIEKIQKAGGKIEIIE
ncbi:MAG: 50S ribosomal protein L15 [Omnitrophica WOR_2 bacterium RIFCSPLOWO2_12_FULL_46_30]|nr:MAG: 50S ribosomal protein L15 [Omnitrophica WOR_2 bacterium RIFCSPHIGHO2_02_FULL_46_37]OGX43021.1 MAG: 50S ribosomal protein L15 [Omnitrophica WOR_2 bacterium RIFCSPLOWO2_02_FULL_45_28]OGX49888.1 MAG: 50S ribosomal protein L15 [Omnitrophica WOR_2 bacterium RIFCSPLOWO2_12_FULL_46_30]